MPPAERSAVRARSTGYTSRPVELGVKRACVGCAARFYDLRRVPAMCPKCQAVQPPDRPRAARVAAAYRAAPVRADPVLAEVEAVTEGIEVDADADDGEAPADTDTDDDDDDVLPAPVLE